MDPIALRGCPPEPLGNYLKALGVFRLVAEQKDEKVRGWWADGCFWLASRFDKRGVIQYFRDDYAPSPIFAPWGGRRGFSPQGNKEAWNRLQWLLRTTHARFQASCEVVKSLVEKSSPLANLAQKKKLTNDEKTDLIKACRRVWPSAALRWLDAVVAIEEKRQNFGALLGTGGNEGSADLTNNFWEMIETTVSLKRKMPVPSEIWLRGALFSEIAAGGISTTAGQNFPRATEAPNHGQFFVGQMPTNPWDFILMMEGCLLFAGSITKRLATNGNGKAAFPFMLDGIAVGSGMLSVDDGGVRERNPICRAEFWMPVWRSPISLAELQAIISEGRLQCHGGQSASHSTEALEAIGNLGVDRGIRAFRRTGLYMRRGKGYYIASSLGEYEVPPRRSSLFSYLADLKEFRLRLRLGREIPRRIASITSDLEDAIFAAIRADIQSPRTLSSGHIQRILLALYKCEAELVTLPNVQNRVWPQRPLGRRWFHAVDGYPGLIDNTPEFRLAAAIASLTPWPQENGERPVVDTIRPYLLPVSRKSVGSGGWTWADNGHSASAVWSSGNIARNLASVLRRRLIDSSRSTAGGLPFSGQEPVSFQDILALWHGEVDEARMDELIHALALLDWGSGGGSDRKSTPDPSSTTLWMNEGGIVHFRQNDLLEHLRAEVDAAAALPRAYALLKLCFLGGRLPPRPVEGRTVYPEGGEPYPPRAPGVLSLLLANRASEALSVAARKLRAVGYPPLIPENAFESDEFAMNGEECRRLAAMLLIPVRHPGALCAMVIRPTLYSGG